MSSRDIKDLIPEMQCYYAFFDYEMKKIGIDYIVTCTYRLQAEQDLLYAQGRTMPGMIVTWNKHSKHTKREAFDIAVITNGKLNWGNKAYEIPGMIGEKVGLVWGGHFKKPDRPHFQLKRS